MAILLWINLLLGSGARTRFLILFRVLSSWIATLSLLPCSYSYLFEAARRAPWPYHKMLSSFPASVDLICLAGSLNWRISNWWIAADTLYVYIVLVGVGIWVRGATQRFSVRASACLFAYSVCVFSLSLLVLFLGLLSTALLGSGMAAGLAAFTSISPAAFARRAHINSDPQTYTSSLLRKAG